MPTLEEIRLLRLKKDRKLLRAKNREQNFSKILTLSSIFVGFVMAFYHFFPVFASPPSTPYAPGETTDPSCSPGDTNCTVYPPLTTTLTASTTITMGTSSLKFAYDSSHYAALSIGTDGSIAVASSSGGSLLKITANGNVGIGTTTPAQKLSVSGNISNIIDRGTTIGQIATATVGAGPIAVFVSGRYAYVANYSANSISVVDISNPNAPVQIGTTSVGTKPSDIYVSGRYAYVANENPQPGPYCCGSMSIVDISNPKHPVQVSTSSVGSRPDSIFISGQYAYAPSDDEDNVFVVDVSNPLAPVKVASSSIIDPNHPDENPGSFYVVGRYGYMANYLSNSVSIIDISNPAAPVQIATTSVSSSNPVAISVAGRYAYVAVQTPSILSVVDVSNPAAPVQVATTSIGANPQRIFVSGRYVYTTNFDDNNISIIDISNPLAPRQVATTSVGVWPSGIFVSGRYAYTTSLNDNTISVVDISGTEVTSLIAHNAEVGNLQSRSDIFAQGNIMAGTSLLAGAGGIMSQGALSVFASSTGSTSSIFSISSAQRSNIIKVFATGTISIGTSTVSAYKLYIDAGASTTAGLGVNGYIKASGFVAGTTTLDIAETYPLNPACDAAGNLPAGQAGCPQVGDVVCTSGDASNSIFIEKCSTTSTDNIVGVISGNPGFVLGGNEASNLNASGPYPTSFMPVALGGRVPVKVSAANGPIKAGDYLTSSAIPGVAVKVVDGGKSIGMALQSFDGSASDQGTVMVFVNNIWVPGSPIALDEQNSATLPDFTQVILDKFTLSVKNSLRKLGLIIQNGIATVKELFADKVHTQQLCVGATCVDESQLQELLQKTNSQTNSAAGNNSLIIESPPEPKATPTTTADSTNTVSVETSAADNSTSPTDSAVSATSTYAN